MKLKDEYRATLKQSQNTKWLFNDKKSKQNNTEELQKSTLTIFKLQYLQNTCIAYTLFSELFAIPATRRHGSPCMMHTPPAE